MSSQDTRPVGQTTEPKDSETCIVGHHVVTYGKEWAVGIYTRVQKREKKDQVASLDVQAPLKRKSHVESSPNRSL